MTSSASPAANDPWTPLSPLTPALSELRMAGVFYSRAELTAPWALEMPALSDCLSFHSVTSGACWLELDDEEPIHLRTGDFALVPHGRGHLMLSEPGQRPAARVDLLPQEYVGKHYSTLNHGGGGEGSTLVCGVVRFEHPAARQLVALLPRLLVLEAGDDRVPGSVYRLLELMAAETRTAAPGAEAVTTRLADLLVLQALRVWIDRAESSQHGWLAALRDPRLGPAIAAVHRAPAERWTVRRLAQEATMSRSAFAARFTEMVGQPPMTYVTQWRMQLAASWIRADAAQSLGQLAERTGYQSEAAFSRAFKSVVGVSPGVVRRSPDGHSVRAEEERRVRRRV